LWKICYFHIIFNEDIKIFMIFIRSQGSCRLLNNTTIKSRKLSFPKCIHKNKWFYFKFFNLDRASFKVSLLRLVRLGPLQHNYLLCNKKTTSVLISLIKIIFVFNLFILYRLPTYNQTYCWFVAGSGRKRKPQ